MAVITSNQITFIDNTNTQQYLYIRYSANANGSNMTDTPQNDSKYMGVCSTTSRNVPNYTQFTWSLIKGADGVDGANGVPGETGKTLYTWIKYADNAQGSGMSDTPDNKRYLGVAYNKESATESSTPSDYTWSLIQGADGSDGTPGRGVQSITEYYLKSKQNFGVSKDDTNWSTTIPIIDSEYKYLWNYEKTVFTTGDITTTEPIVIGVHGINGIDGKDGTSVKILGSYDSESNLPSSYDGEIGDGYLINGALHIWNGSEWTNVGSIQGPAGTDGVGVVSITELYYLSTSKTEQIGDEWSETPKTWSLGKYLWTKSAILYTNSETPVYTTPICDSSWEAVNEIQIGGRNLLRNSRHITLRSNNPSAHPITSETLTENGREFMRYRRSETSLNPRIMSLYNSFLSTNVTEHLLNQEITFSFLIRCSHATTTTIMATLIIDSDTYQINNTETTYNIGSDWQRLSVTTTVTQDYQYASNVKFRFCPHLIAIPAGETDNFYMDICEWKIEKGNLATDWTPAPEDMQRELEIFASETTENLENIQNQLDGNITTWFKDYTPLTTNEPASLWDESAKENHLGDTFYITSGDNAGKTYVWEKSSSVYQWIEVSDAELAKALDNAKKAQDTADGKRRVFIQQPTPPYDEGDMWTQGADGELMVCTNARTSGSYISSDWTKASKYTDDTAINNLQIGGTNLLKNTSNVWTDVEVTNSASTVIGEIVIADAGLKVGDTITVSAHIKPLVKSQLRIRIDWVDESNNRTSNYSNSVITKGEEGISSLTLTVPEGYIKIRIRIANYNTTTETSTTVEQYRCLKLERGSKATDWTPALEESTRTVDVEYYLSESTTELINGEWLTNAPQWENGKYMWSRTKVTYQNGDIEYRPSENGVCIAGAQGQTSYLHIKYSDDGNSFTANDGETLGAYIGTYVDFDENDSLEFDDYMWRKYIGDDGAGISNVINLYQATSNLTPPNETDTNWGSAIPNVDSTNRYLWNKEIVEYTNGKNDDTFVSLIGIYGDTGENAITFGIYSSNGLAFKEDTEFIELQTIAYDGSTVIAETEIEYAWYYGDNDNEVLVETYNDNNETELTHCKEKSLTVYKNTDYAESTIKCVMTYKGVDYIDYISLVNESVIYNADISFANGTHILRSTDKYLAGYVSLYRNNKEIDPLVTTQINDVEIDATEDGSCFNSSFSKTDLKIGDYRYFTHQENSKYKIDLGQYIGGVNLDDNTETSKTAYEIGRYRPTTLLIPGETYKITMSITPAQTDMDGVSILFSKGYAGAVRWGLSNNTQQTLTKIFTMPNYTTDKTPEDDIGNGDVYIYRTPYNATYTDGTIIHSIKIEHIPADNHIAGNRNLLSNSKVPTNIRSNNTTVYPILYNKMKDDTREFVRVQRNGGTSPNAVSLYNYFYLNSITESILGKEITMSYLIRSSHEIDISSMCRAVKTVDGSNANVVLSDEKNTDHVGSIWTRVYRTVTIPNDDSIHMIRFSPYFTDDIPEDEVNDFYIDICEWKIEFGNTVTNWVPSISDGYNWKKVNPYEYSYKDSIHDISGKAFVIHREDIQNNTTITFEIYNNISNSDTSINNIVARASASVIDLNDPVVSDIEPENPIEGQLWINTLETPSVLKMYVGGIWVNTSTQQGAVTHTSLPYEYNQGDLWVLSENDLATIFWRERDSNITDDYNVGDILKAKRGTISSDGKILPLIQKLDISKMESNRIKLDEHIKYIIRVVIDDEDIPPVKNESSYNWETMTLSQNNYLVFYGDLKPTSDNKVIVYGYNEEDWELVDPEGVAQKQNIKKYMEFSPSNGLKIGDSDYAEISNNVLQKFYVQIGSKEMGFYSQKAEVKDGEIIPEEANEIVTLGVDDATILNPTVKGVFTIGTFKLQIEPNGSLSII